MYSIISSLSMPRREVTLGLLVTLKPTWFHRNTLSQRTFLKYRKTYCSIGLDVNTGVWKWVQSAAFGKKCFSSPHAVFPLFMVLKWILPAPSASRRIGKIMPRWVMCVKGQWQKECMMGKKPSSCTCFLLRATAPTRCTVTLVTCVLAA